MEKSEAKVGVRVRVVEDRIGDLSDKSFKERKGTIRGVTNLIYDIGVEFDTNLGNHGHNLGGLCTYGYGRYGYLEDFEVIKKVIKKGVKKNVNPTRRKTKDR